MNLLESIFLGFIQGITEFLPVSSSGHLAIFENLFHIDTVLLCIRVTERYVLF